jgi:hypothetical protein
MLPPGRARLATNPAPIDHTREHYWDGAGRPLQRGHDRTGRSKNHIRFKRHEFHCISVVAFSITRAPANIDSGIAPVGPTQFLQRLNESNNPSLPVRIIGTRVHQHADAAHPLTLLRPRRDRPRCRRTAEQCDERAPPHGHPSSGLGRHITRRYARTPLCIAAKIAR